MSSNVPTRAMLNYAQAVWAEEGLGAEDIPRLKTVLGEDMESARNEMWDGPVSWVDEIWGFVSSWVDWREVEEGLESWCQQQKQQQQG